MRSKILKKENDLVIFVSEYNRLAGSVRYDASEIENLKVRAFYKADGKMAAGYAVNNKPPYKTLSYVSKDNNIENIFDKSDKEICFSEVVALWINKSASNILRAKVYSMSIIDCALMRPDYILGGCSLSGARRTQMRALSNLLWEGEGAPFNKKKHYWVYYASPTEAIFRLPYAITMGWIDRFFPVKRITKCCSKLAKARDAEHSR